jgi:hypothetical protein
LSTIVFEELTEVRRYPQQFSVLSHLLKKIQALELKYSSPLKGQSQKMDIFPKVNRIKSVFSICAVGFKKYPKWLSVLIFSKFLVAFINFLFKNPY